MQISGALGQVMDKLQKSNIHWFSCKSIIKSLPLRTWLGNGDTLLIPMVMIQHPKTSFAQKRQFLNRTLSLFLAWLGLGQTPEYTKFLFYLKRVNIIHFLNQVSVVRCQLSNVNKTLVQFIIYRTGAIKCKEMGS